MDEDITGQVEFKENRNGKQKRSSFLLILGVVVCKYKTDYMNYRVPTVK